MPSSTPRPGWVVWALVAYAAAAGIVLLSPIGPGRVLAWIVRWIREGLGFTSFRQGWIEAPANVLLFVPLGVLLTLLFRRAWIGVTTAVLLSIAAELVQIVLPDRMPSLRDIVANALGAVLGAALAWAVLMARRRSHRRRSRREPERPTGTTRAR